ncbi:hypothetical protein KQH49_07310 [Mycetohabitans sp. B5]|uniref:Uncharacterized protein n=2 Tax=Mycetohabitans endofungorum TaxID=417203 RepID=A0A2P5KAU0_9BURK|nr:hypothetical protein [Mycetohabitans sp. B5]MCG1054774.1 hypothetical protein [Mycetohabitans sp. B5]PPB83832.1 hypothetical protein B0O95_10513 [Mycetohabitans endofungorum]
MSTSKTEKQSEMQSSSPYRPEPSLAAVRDAFTIKPGMVAAVPRAADFVNLIDLANRATLLGLGSESAPGPGLKIGTAGADIGKAMLNLTDADAGGLKVAENVLSVAAGPGVRLERNVGLHLILTSAGGLQLDQDTGALDVKLAQHGGLTCKQASDGSSQLSVNAGAGLALTNTGLQVRPGRGVEFDAESPRPALQIQCDEGVASDEVGLAVALAPNGGLKFDGNGELTLDLEDLMS